MNNHKFTPLTESALLVALTVVMALIALYVPVISIIAAVIWALPLVITVVRHGLKRGVMALLAVALILSMLSEPLIAIRMTLFFGIPGLMLGYGFEKMWPSAKILTAALIVSLLSKIAAMAVFFLATGINFLDMSIDMLRDSFDMSFQLYEELNVPEDQLNQAKSDVDGSLDMLTLFMPLMVFFMAVVDTLINYLVAGRVIKRLGITVPTLPPFTEWRLPSAFLYLFGFSLVGLYWGSTREIDVLYTASLNAYMLSMFAGLLQGFALVFFAAQRFGVSTLWLVIITVVIIASGILTEVVSFTGLFDMFFDYRRRFGGGLLR